ncbi:MAG: hypothetical protein GXP62_04320 [Oligoflexia bacterium]|nr:hypothetical protein [Oligoflexia bacterium]
MKRRHASIPAQGKWLRSVVQGFFQYVAVSTNSRRLRQFLKEVHRAWMHALRRPSQTHRMTWKRLYRLTDRWLPKPRILHPWPHDHFNARLRGRSPVR